MSFDIEDTISDNYLYDIAKRIRSGEGLMTIVLDVMETVEKIKNLDGVYKKKLVVDVIEDILIDLYGKDYYIGKYRDYVNDIIEFVIFLSRSKILINKTKKCFKRLC